MVSKTMPRRVARWVFAQIAACIALTGCGQVYNLYAPPGATIHASMPGNYENPDKYRVAGSASRTYVATKTFSPPSPVEGDFRYRFTMVDIQQGDVWTVTHSVHGRLIVFSEDYQARQQRYRRGNDLFALLIDADGRVNRGWFVLKNPKLVVLSSERMTIMDPSIRDTDGWPTEPVFRLVQQ